MYIYIEPNSLKNSNRFTIYVCIYINNQNNNGTSCVSVDGMEFSHFCILNAFVRNINFQFHFNNAYICNSLWCCCSHYCLPLVSVCVSFFFLFLFIFLEYLGLFDFICACLHVCIGVLQFSVYYYLILNCLSVT